VRHRVKLIDEAHRTFYVARQTEFTAVVSRREPEKAWLYHNIENARMAAQRWRYAFRIMGINMIAEIEDVES
jgi:hypothetical protein